MSFLMFQVIFAALALGLLVIVVLIVRQNVAKRTPEANQAADETAPKVPKLRRPGLGSLGRKVAEPEPEASVPEAPARRRQLQTFADAERSAAEAEAVVLPVAVAEPEQEADTAAQSEFAAEAEIALAEPEPEPELAPAADAAPDYSDEVLSRLEDAFEALQSGELTLADYRARVLAEEAAVQGRIAELEDGGDSDELDAALAARDSVRWCLDWAEEQAAAES